MTGALALFVVGASLSNGWIVRSPPRCLRISNRAATGIERTRGIAKFWPEQFMAQDKAESEPRLKCLCRQINFSGSR